MADTPPVPPAQDPLALYQGVVPPLMDAMGQVVVGQQQVIGELLTALLADGHVLLEGVPGLAKTLMARTLSQLLHLTFNRIQFTPDLMPADVIGTRILMEEDSGKRGFQFEAGPVFTHLLLADEINRTTPKTQSALLEAMQERRVSVAGTTYQLGPPFFVVATQNPLEMEGTFPLPEAQLDRFLFKVNVPFPGREELVQISEVSPKAERLQLQPIVSRENLLALMAAVREVVVAQPVRQLAADLVLATHPDHPTAPEPVKRFVRYGASPRGVLALVGAAKVRAVAHGRLNVANTDIMEVLLPALRHRLILNYEGEAEAVTTDSVIEAVSKAVK